MAENDLLKRQELAQAQQKLEAAMEEACDSDVKNADTAELIRIEGSLATASVAAKEAISARKLLRQEREESQTVPEIHRRFDDANGVQWVAFAVYPSRGTAGRGALPHPYQGGWLSFDSGTETRRLAPIPDGWKELQDDGLRQLCEKAEIAPRRKRKSS